MFVLFPSFLTWMQSVYIEYNCISFGLSSLNWIFANQLIVKPYIRTAFLDAFLCWTQNLLVYLGIRIDLVSPNLFLAEGSGSNTVFYLFGCKLSYTAFCVVATKPKRKPFGISCSSDTNAIINQERNSPRVYIKHYLVSPFYVVYRCDDCTCCFYGFVYFGMNPAKGKYLLVKSRASFNTIVLWFFPRLHRIL